MKDKLKRFLACTMALAMLMTMVPAVYAEETAQPVDAAGLMEAPEPKKVPSLSVHYSPEKENALGEPCGDNLTWDFQDGTLTVSGTGPMYDYLEYYGPWYDYMDQITRIVIEEGVNTVGGGAFADCVNLTSVELPEGLVSIGDSAFLYSQLNSVTIPSSVAYIDKYAFDLIPTLESVVVAQDNEIYTSLDGILYSKDMTSLVFCPEGKQMDHFVIPETVRDIAEYACEGCSGIMALTLPEGLIAINHGAFYGTSITEIKLPSTVTYIGAYSFSRTKLTEFTINAAAENVFSGCVGDCDELMNIYVEEGSTHFTSVDGVVYNFSRGFLFLYPAGRSGAATIAEDIYGIFNAAFYGCDKITEVTIPASIGSIKSGAFFDCTNLKTIRFLGNAPYIMEDEIFYNVTATAYYPAFNPTWNVENKQNYGGTITWVESEPDNTVIAQGDCSETISWSLTASGVLTISGTGALPYDYSATPWDSYKNQIFKVVIEEGITDTGNGTFGGYYNLHYLELPDSLEYIGNYAFGSTSIRELVIPSGVCEISSSALMDCMNLETITVDPENTAYSSLDNVLYSKDMTVLVSAPKAFNGQLNIPETVVSIGGGAFLRSMLSGIHIPASVTEIGYNAIADMPNMQSLTVAPENEVFCVIDDVLYGYGITEAIYCLPGKTGELVIPETVQNIADRAFWGTGITSAVIPGSVSYIDAYAFGYCADLTRVEIGSGVTQLPYGCFVNCTALTEITVPASVSFISGFVFDGCSALSKITFLGNAPGSAAQYGEAPLSGVTATAYYPAGNPTWTEEVRASYGGSITWEAVEAEVAEIASGICGDTVSWSLDSNGVLTISGSGPMEIENDESPWHAYTNLITAVVVEDGITSVGDFAFFECVSLSRITLPDSITSIGDHAIFSCGNLTSFTIPEKVTSIGVGAFAYCHALRSLHIPAAVTAIGVGAFRNCNALTTLTVDSTNASFCAQDNILYTKDMTCLVQGLYGIYETVTIPATVKHIAADAFYGSRIPGVILPEGLQTIGSDAFGTSKLTEVTIPASVTSIDGSFSRCQELEAIHVAPGNQAYASQDGVLYNAAMDTLIQYPCNGPRSFEVPKSVKALADGAFMCAGVQELTLPEGLERIGWWSLSEMYELTSLTIPASVTQIDAYALAWSTMLTEITFLGDAPTFGNEYEQCVFEEVTATAYYPADNPTWTEAVLQNYGGTITWVPQGSSHTHSYQTVVTAPTCTEQGYTTYTCQCGDSYRDSYTAALGHDWVLTDSKEPTASEDGYKKYGCSRCDETKTETIPATGEIENPFTDVPAGAYYEKSVLWALNQGITGGTSATTFGSTQNCTREQVVMFLWNANGAPEPTLTKSPFTDVPAGKYYTKAVLWAYENGIAGGTSATTFGVGKEVTRAQFVTFLYNAMGKPEVTGTTSFTDVPANAYYAKPVLWAVQNGITGGTSATTFSPSKACTRAQVVTFLYQAYGKT